MSKVRIIELDPLVYSVQLGEIYVVVPEEKQSEIVKCIVSLFTEPEDIPQIAIYDDDGDQIIIDSTCVEEVPVCIEYS